MKNQIIIASTKSEFEECFIFFKKMWKELFEIDFDINFEKRKKEFYESDIYYTKNKDEIIGISQFVKVLKGYKLSNGLIIEKDAYILGRIGVLKEYRKQGLGSNLIQYGIKKIYDSGIKIIYVPSEINNVNYYLRFGFKIFGKDGPIGNTRGIYMKKEL